MTASDETQGRDAVTAAEINKLPQRVRDYIHWLETDADPQGTIRENFRLRDENKNLRVECERLSTLPSRDAALEEAALLAIKAADFGFHSSMIAFSIRALKSKPAQPQPSVLSEEELTWLICPFIREWGCAERRRLTL